MQGEDYELFECNSQCSGHFQPSRGFSRVKGLIPGLYVVCESQLANGYDLPKFRQI